MMLLYLTSNLNLGLLDFIQDENIPIKKLSGEFNLKKFVIRDMRSFSHFKYVLIDHQSLNDSDEEIIEGILGFRAMYDARIIYLAEGMKPGEELLSMLYDAGVRNFITAVDPEVIKQEIVECISSEGMIYGKAERFKIQPVEEIIPKLKRAKVKSKPVNEKRGEQEGAEYVEVNETTKLGLDLNDERKGIIITVAGIDTRVGTTTTALNLAFFLSNMGAKVGYVEGDGKLLEWLVSYGVFLIDDKAEYKGISFYNRKAGFDTTQVDFVILDIGVLSERNIGALKEESINIICASSKPYELNSLCRKIELIKGTPVNILFSFASDHDRQTLRQLTSELLEFRMFFAAYSPDLFDPNPNRMIWTSIMSDYIVAIPTEQIKKKRLRVS